MSSNSKKINKKDKKHGILTSFNFFSYTHIMDNKPIGEHVSKVREFINSNEKHFITASIIVLAVVLILDFVYVYSLLNKNTTPFSMFTNKSQTNYPSLSSKAPTPTLTPTPTPTPVPLLQGPQSYSISTKQNPDMYDLSLNTIDPHNSTQTVQLKVKDPSSVTSVKANVKTENKSKEYPLSLQSGTANDGTWTGSWVLNDTYNKKFMITFSATDNKGSKSSVDFTIR